MRQPILQRLRQEIFDPEMETILHPSSLRFKVLGFFTLTGHLLFWYIWGVALPQPYENLYVRCVLALLGAGLFIEKINFDKVGINSYRYSFAIFWLQLPVFFTWMYWMNHGNAIWLASMAAMVLIYYHFTDWRLATIGLLTGIPLATAIAQWQLNVLYSPPASDTVVLAFCFFSAAALGASNANLRRERLQHSLVVMGIMAHELRTPLATISLIGHAILREATTSDEKARIRGLTTLANRLETLTHTINHHIDLQMVNARFMQLPQTKQLISATGIINNVVTNYPFNSRIEEECVEVITQEDFMFYGSEWQFAQVLNNLLKNALYSLKVAQSRFSAGDLIIELSMKNGVGKISISDKGMGIDASDLPHIFEPFFSTNHETGHGLGLAYCKQVIQAYGGVINVESKPLVGATFTIELPFQKISSNGI